MTQEWLLLRPYRALTGFVVGKETFKWRAEVVQSLRFRLLIAAAIALALPVWAFPAVVVNETRRNSFTTSNPCNGERVDFSGTVHIVVSDAVDSSGGLNFDERFQAQLTGTGETTGTNYVAARTAHFVRNFNSGATITETAQITFRVISHGSAPNFIMHTVSHNAIKPDGTTTSSVASSSSQCTG